MKQLISIVFAVTVVLAPEGAKADFIFGTPTNLGPTVNSSASESSPSISADGLALYFSSNRPGGSGGTDLWVTTRATTDDDWEEPVNLGPGINSIWSDTGTSVTADMSVLYFASSRDGGYGGRDIWQAPILWDALCGDNDHPYPLGDLNHDCRVDCLDMALMSMHWLEDNNP